MSLLGSPSLPSGSSAGVFLGIRLVPERRELPGVLLGFQGSLQALVVYHITAHCQPIYAPICKIIGIYFLGFLGQRQRSWGRSASRAPQGRGASAAGRSTSAPDVVSYLTVIDACLQGQKLTTAGPATA